MCSSVLDTKFLQVKELCLIYIGIYLYLPHSLGSPQRAGRVPGGELGAVGGCGVVCGMDPSPTCLRPLHTLSSAWTVFALFVHLLEEYPSF